MHAKSQLPRPIITTLSLLGALTLLLLAAPLCSAATYYVSPSGSDTNPGTLAAPYLTIQAAINHASSGDTVTLEDGTYTGTGDVDMDFGGKNLTVNSQNGPTSAIIDCGGSNHRGFYFHLYETNAIISGLTIKNGNANGTGGGVYNTGTAKLSGCILSGNTASSGNGGGVDNISGGTATLINCSLSGNIASSASQQGGAVENDGTATLTNDILWGDIANTGRE